MMLLVGAAMLSACGSSGSSTSTTGNTVSGKVSLGDSVATAKSGGPQVSFALTAYQGSAVQLVDASGNVVEETTTDASGQFTFLNVAQGDYTLRVIDATTGLAVTQVSFSVVDGDNAYIEGTIDTAGADWTIDYTAGEASLQNDAQMEIARNLADNSDLSLSEIITMREDGAGWGKIAGELGVSPGVLGLGHSDGFEPEKHSTIDNDDVEKPNGNSCANTGNPNCDDSIDVEVETPGDVEHGNSGNNGNGNSENAGNENNGNGKP
jgi:hypothetical protein